MNFLKEISALRNSVDLLYEETIPREKILERKRERESSQWK